MSGLERNMIFEIQIFITDELPFELCKRELGCWGPDAENIARN